MDVCANRYGVASLSVGDASGVGWGAKYERAKADVGSGMRAAQGRALLGRARDRALAFVRRQDRHGQR